MKTTFKTRGVCSSLIDIEIENGVITDVSFTGGCNGNAQGVSRLVTGQKVEDVIELLGGIRCGRRETSCPDQLATALKSMLD